MSSSDSQQRCFYVFAHSISSDSQAKKKFDELDEFNRPRLRQSLIIASIAAAAPSADDVFDESLPIFSIQYPSAPVNFVDLYKNVHDVSMLEFLLSAWDAWVDLGERRDRGNFHPSFIQTSSTIEIPPLVPSQTPLHRDRDSQRAGSNVMGAIGYYCTDTCTPIVLSLVDELNWDAAVVLAALKQIGENGDSAYAVCTHPGHHSSYDSFGGYCYVNHAAMAARYLQSGQFNHKKIAILDIDYHAGNGTSSIFYSDPSVFVVSIHCHPKDEYPFNSGWEDQRGQGEAFGTCLNFPLPAGTTFDTYSGALEKALEEISRFGATILIVSLGLDTYEGDDVAVPKAGFRLQADDYWKMGSMIRDLSSVPTLFIQEGGYKMDVVGAIAFKVIAGFHDINGVLKAI